MKTIAVIDGNSLMHRAFHAVPPYMTAPDGSPTNAVFGFLQMFIKLAEDFAPDGIVCAFDHGVPQFRFDAIKEYKAQRPPTDPELKSQFPIIKDLLAAMDVPVVELDQWEGDDILGTVAHKAEAASITALLVTGDKDALQLVSDTTRVINTKKGMSDVIVYDADAVFAKWGVTPAQVPDFLGLMGDASDNIPGVPGVGPKKATALLQEYGTLEAVLANAENIKGKMGESLSQNKELALASREVATIICDIDLDLDIQSVQFGNYNLQTVNDTFGKYALQQPLRRLLALSGKAQVELDTDAVSTGNPLCEQVADINLLTDNAAADTLEHWLTSGKPIGLRLANAAGDDDLNLFTASKDLYIAGTEGVLQFTEGNFAPVLSAVFDGSSQSLVIAHDLKSILHNQPGLPVANTADNDLAKRLFDVGIAAYLLDSGTVYDALDKVVGRFLGAPLPEPQDDLPQAAVEACALLALHDVLQSQLEGDESLACFADIEMPLVPVLCRMEYLGVDVDVQLLQKIDAELTETINNLKDQATTLAGEEFNLDSPKQLGVVLFETLGLPTAKKKKTGYSTDASVLTELKAMHPLPGVMLEYRELAKLKSTYLDALPKLVAADGHIHTTYNQAVAATGRLSSSDPNLQNIPVRTDLGRRIREAFIADPGAFSPSAQAVFVSADYSQIELRLLAHLSGDEQLIAAFLHGEDFHAETAARVFAVDVKDVTPQMRSRAKAVNFGIVYGQQAFGLAQSLGVSFEEAQDMIDRYFAAYPQVRAYLDSCISDARRQGWVQTMFGRKRRIAEIHSTNHNLRSFAERTATNHPMQGTAADIIKLAMISVARRLESEGLAAQMILQVHDELDFNCPMAELETLVVLVKEEMENVVELKVPLTASVTSAPNWAAAH